MKDSITGNDVIIASGSLVNRDYTKNVLEKDVSHHYSVRSFKI